MASCGYVGKGKVYLDGRFVGNVSALNIAITEEKLEQSNYTTGGGGNCAVVRRIDAVEMSMTMTSYDADNLALAVFGTAAAEDVTPIVGEAQTTPSALDEDTLIVTDKVIDLTGTTTVDTYVEGTDFTVSPAGITVLAAGSIPVDTALSIGYTPLGANVVQALITSPATYTVTFDGLNEADSGASVVIKAYKVQFGPTEDLAFIADDFAELALTGDILLDETIVGAGLSQYFTITAAT